MRSLLVAVTTLMLFAAGSVQAKVAITVDKDAQMMTVAVDGVERYRWPVSSGVPSRETPSGSFRAFRMEASHFSKEFDDAPMPHSIFFTKEGHAIHGTDSEGRLGTPASHGCVRLSKANATTLYALVQEQGVLNTSVTLTGSASVALARNPRRNTAVARAEPQQAPPQQQQQQYQQQPYQQQYAQPQYSDSGEPAVLTPQPQYLPGRRPAQPLPQQQRVDDGYIYPADGSPADQRYPMPRSTQRAYNGQGYYQQQPAYTDGYGYPVQQPQQRYYQQRGLYGYPD
jgi:L,D-transpeptidase catalytic domain